MFVKGHGKIGGRTKGAKNKNSQQLRDMILCALSEVGGVDYLVEQARENPGPFLSLLAKVLPTEISTAGDSSAKLTISYVSADYVAPRIVNAQTDAVEHVVEQTTNIDSVVIEPARSIEPVRKTLTFSEFIRNHD